MKRKIYKFPNGATLLYKRQKDFDVTSCYAGFVDSGFFSCKEKLGLPHFLEHNLFNGTKNRTREQIDKDKISITALNAFTNTDSIMTVFCESNRRVEKCFEFSSDVLLNSVFNQEAMTKEAKVVLEEKSRYENNKKFNFCWQYDDFFHTDNPTPDTIFGTDELLYSYTPADMEEFKKEHFVAEKFIITVCSSLPFWKIKKLANKYFIKNLTESETKLPETFFRLQELNQVESVKAYNIPKENYEVIFMLAYNSDVDKYRYDQNDTFISTLIRRDPKLFYVEARKAGLIYSAVCTNSYKPLLTRNGYTFKFATSKFENIEKLFEIINKTLVYMKEGKFTDEDIEDIREKKLADLDKENFVYSMTRVDAMLNAYGKRHRFDVSKKKDKVKEIKKVNRESMQDFINLIFNKDNDLMIFMQGNFEGKDVKSIEYYKSILFKDIK